MHFFAIFVLFQQLAPAPFWETKPAAKWTNAEIEVLMTQSPWGVPTFSGNAKSAGEASVAFLASARPLREAEEQLFLRREIKGEARSDEDDYRAYISQNPGKHIVLAVRMAPNDALSDAAETKIMEKECFVRIGKRKLKAVGHFPPTPSDPYLRLLFPRASLAGLKALSFGLYLPGLNRPFHDVELPVKDLTYRGQLEY